MGLSEPTPTGSLHLIGHSIRQIIRLSKSHNLYFHALFSKCIRTNPDHFDMHSLVTHHTVRFIVTYSFPITSRNNDKNVFYLLKMAYLIHIALGSTFFVLNFMLFQHAEFATYGKKTVLKVRFLQQ